MKNAFGNALADMFQKFGGSAHFIFEDLVDVRITDGTSQIISLGSMAEIGLQLQVNGEISADGVFLWINSMKGI